MSLLLAVNAAFALSNFPGLVQDELAMDCAPSCMLCHTTPAGGAGTATQSFADALAAEGFSVADTATLATALAAVQSKGTTYDGNGDGVNDVDELAVGENPNADGTDFCPADGDAPPTLTRGCFAEGGDTAAAGLGLGLAAAALRRARRR